jgi:hypothetical protein
MPDFPSSPKPHYPIDETPVAPEVLVTVHRDGSEQRRYKGPGKRRTFRLSFGSSLPITLAERNAILDHWTEENGTALSFSWTHPERTEETYTVRYAEAPSCRHVGYDAYEVEVTLQEVA